MAVYSPKMRSLELLSSSCKPQNFWSSIKIGGRTQTDPCWRWKITVFGEAEVRPTTAGFEKKHSTRFWPKRALIHNRQRQGWRRGRFSDRRKCGGKKTVISFCARCVSPALTSRGHRKPHVEMEESGKTCPITKQMKEGTSFRPYSSSKTTCFTLNAVRHRSWKQIHFQEITGKIAGPLC